MLESRSRENWIPIFKWIFPSLMFVCVLVFREHPVEPVVKRMSSLIEIFGLLAVAGLSAFNIATSSGRASVSELAYRCLKRLFNYSIALWLIGNYGDAVYRWLLEAQSGELAFASLLFAIWIGLVLMILMAQFSNRLFSEPERIPRTACSVAVKTSQKPTERDRRYTAAHEAGHALVYAAFGYLPEGARVVINDGSDERGVLGYVTGIQSEHLLNEKSFAELYMLVLLAGAFGERAMYGESTLGSASDNNRWLDIARVYLANNYRGIYYADPSSKFEQEQNEAKLEALHADQKAMLCTFFELNRDLLQQFADNLFSVGVMERGELISILSHVKLPKDFPQPIRK